MPEDAEKKEEGKDEDKVVLKVDMHCQACKEKVQKSLMGFPGLEKIDIDMNTQKVTIKGKVDAKTLFETVRKKSGRRTELLFPQIKKEEEKREEKKGEKKKEEVIIDSILKTIDSITALFSNPPDVTVVLQVKMHCGGCAKEVQKTLEKMDGVHNVKVDLQGEKVTVKGKNLDPKKLCDRVTKKTGKHATIVPPPKQEKKETEKEEEAKKEEKKSEGKKEEKSGERGEKTEEQMEEKSGEKKGEQKKCEQTRAKSVPEYVYVYPPQFFSDENPNACSIM